MKITNEHVGRWVRIGTVWQRNEPGVASIVRINGEKVFIRRISGEEELIDIDTEIYEIDNQEMYDNIGR